MFVTNLTCWNEHILIGNIHKNELSGFAARVRFLQKKIAEQHYSL